MNDWPRVKEIFHGALEREPADRLAFLNASCGHEGDVRAEVERLLAAHERAGSFIEASPVAMTGRVIGHYRIDRALAAGGMGQVYVAHDVELDRTVAIKIALGHDGDAHARLKREAQHASKLNHPNICTIHEIGAFDGQPFIAMEYVDGRSLAEVIAAGNLPVEQVARYGAQVAGALAHAHQHGVVHRDLKSANVMVTPDERVKVLDFGLARRHSAERLKDLSLSRESLTREEPIAGTLSCMAPEVLRGATADERSDMWALGVLLYEMASGRRPFSGATGFEVSGAILHEPPAPLSDRVPPALRETIGRCLEKAPDDRYQRADQVREALRGSTKVEPYAFGVEPYEFRVEPSKPVGLDFNRVGLGFSRATASRTGRVMTAAALVLLAALLVAAAVAWRGTGSSAAPVMTVTPENAHTIAVMNFENVAGAQEINWLSKGVPRILVTGLAQTSGLSIVSAQHLEEATRKMGRTTVDVLTSAEFADVARRSGAGAVVSGSIMKAGEEIRVDVQLHDLASGRVLVAETARGTDVFALVDHLTSRIRAASGFSGTEGVRRVADVSSSSLEAYRLYSEGVDAYLNMRWSDGIALLERATAIDPGFAEAYIQLAVASGHRGSQIARREYLRKAAQYGDRLNTQQRRFLDLQLARADGDSIKAAQLLDQFIADYPRVEDAYSIAPNLYNPMLGGLLDFPKLLLISDIGVKTLPSSGPARNTRGYALLGVGRPAEALREFEIYARLAPREPNPYDSMGEAYLHLGMPDKAVESYSRALAVDHTFDESRKGQALSLAVLGRFDEAIAAKPALASEMALLLSRVGRYREAAQAIISAPFGKDTGLDILADAVPHLLASIVALERHDEVRAMREADAAERVFAGSEHPRKQVYMVGTHLLAGVAAARSGRLPEARERLEQQKRLYRPEFPLELWWHKALEGEIALASGDPQRASAVLSEGLPKGKYFCFDSVGAVLLVNHLPVRDALARAAKARGDLAGAIAAYRKLLTPNADSIWVSALEPRYVLELARLLEKTGDRPGALKEYERFLDLWKQADPGLPEFAEARRAVARLHG